MGKDHYLEDSSRLQGQPKRTLGDYVEQNGILVPRRFNSLDEARKSHNRILLRSEHPQEYDGVSGLLHSFNLSHIAFKIKGSKDIEEVKEKYFSYLELRGSKGWQVYCEMTNTDVDDFKNQTSFSIWEHIEGYNRTVVADPAIKGRYHITGFKEGKTKTFCNYSIFDNGELTQYCDDLPKKLRLDLENLIDTYEQVRNLPNFDSNHCPIMEFQTKTTKTKVKNYFLQYHRGRDFKKAEFVLDREPTAGEVSASLVLGATPPDGINCKVTLFYGDRNSFIPDTENEEGSYDFHYSTIFSESRFRHRKVQMISLHDTGDLESVGELLNYNLRKFTSSHKNKSLLFKPNLSVLRELYSVCPEDEMNKLGWRTDYENINSYINLHITSDGRKAYIKRLKDN